MGQITGVFFVHIVVNTSHFWSTHQRKCTFPQEIHKGTMPVGCPRKTKRPTVIFTKTVRGDTETQLNNVMEAPLEAQRECTDYSARRCSHSHLPTPLDAYPKLKVLYYIFHLSCKVFLMLLLITAFMDAWRGQRKHIHKYLYKNVDASVDCHDCG